jgi:Domain of unknown function DUF29
MADLYETDTFLWSEQQSDLLRRLAAGERVNDQVDWENIVEEIETVGRSEVRAVTSPLQNGMQHKLYLLGWPNALTVRHWEAEVRVQLAEAADEYRESMRKAIALPTLYRRAVLAAERHMVDEPATTALPASCPWTLEDLLAEGRAALADRG